jgi:hypothetical protein
MKIEKLTGPINLAPLEGGNEGDRVILVEPAPAIQVELGPIPKEVCAILAEQLMLSDDDLKTRLIAEQREQEAMSRLHLPDGVASRNGTRP